MEPQYLGNMELLTLHKVGFLASRHTSPASVLPTLDWATKIRGNPSIAVISGFQSPLERQVLDIALKGNCGIIYVLNRSLYRQIPLNLRPAFDSNRLLFISLTSEKTTRPSAINANIRNRYVAQTASKLIFSSVSPSSSLFILFTEFAPLNKAILL